MCNRAPEARMKIARSFNCGEKPKNQTSPGGAADKIVAGDSVAPPGLVNFMSSRPAVETAGYFQVVPLGRSLPPQAAGGKAERFVKFRPRTTLREIIQLSE
jgi:hypothetical protein